MIKYIAIITSILLAWNVQAQHNYHQQKVDYKIDVTLDDEQHFLHGNLVLQYQNNSPEDLDFIYFHLWPNAYKNKETAFAAQKLRTGSSDFYFTEQENLGYIDSLNFKVSNRHCTLEYDAMYVDIAKLQLSEPLKAGESMEISTPFRVKIPKLHSRLGRIDQYYQITQWYPKPAVFDAEGWHPMPYLDMGEFYSEYGSFDVSITLPENYLVGATGQLITESEKAFRVEREKLGRNHTRGEASALSMKTVQFIAENVHDFAWFTSKDFIVETGTVTLETGKEVKTYAYFPPDAGDGWDEATDYLSRSVKFYSDKVGEYPYPHASAVYGGGTGGGMEYPMITSLSDHGGNKKSLDLVITHEVGHNWFYGILGSNERVYPWMDEGMNSFYENWYMSTNYHDGAGTFSGFSQAELVYLIMAKGGVEDPAQTHSDKYAIDMGYYLGAYAKPPMVLEYLKSYMGETQFDAMMQAYFETWKYKHPQPADFRKIVEEYAKGEDVSWVFDGLIESNHQVDYALTKLQKNEKGYIATVKNRGSINSPIHIAATKDDAIVYSQWLPGSAATQEITIPQGDYDEIVIDPNKKTLDVNNANNRMKAEQGRNLPSLALNPFINLKNDDRTHILLAPALGYNVVDGVMVGLGVYNSFIIPNKLEFALAPMYGVSSNDLVGMGRVRYNIFPKKGVYSKIQLALEGKSFHFEDNKTWRYDLKYRKYSPSILFEFRPKKQNTYNAIQIKTTTVNNQKSEFKAGEFSQVVWDTPKMWHQVKYERKTWSAIHKSKLDFDIEYHKGEDVFSNDMEYLKTRLSFVNEFFYAPKRSVRMRLFVGGFLNNTHQDRNTNLGYPLNLMSSAPSDYMYEVNYLGRSQAEGLAQQQIAYREGGMRYVLDAANIGNIGRSQSFVTSINLTGDLPIKFPLGLKIRPYFDAGYYADGNENTKFGETVIWNGGLTLSLWKETIEVNFPIIASDNLKLYTNQRSPYGKQISFVFDLHQLDPWRILGKVKRGEISVN